MYQLIILLPTGLDLHSFDEGWPQFLDIAEQMPGLIQESITRFDQILYGSETIQRIYTFSFHDKKSLENALVSEQGQKAGNLLHFLSGGNITILTGDHQSDTLDRIQSYITSEKN